ncbi:MAG: hypothetical protein AB7G75_04155 [Candidatus Binatia bacterium]
MTHVRKPTLMLLFCLTVLLSVGCAAKTKTVETETTRYPSTGQPTVVERQTTVTTDSEEDSGGVLSGTVNVVGEVIALPFRAVGGLISAIF